MYDVAQPSLNEETAPRWWRKPCQVGEEDEEPLVFLEIVEAAPILAKGVHFLATEDSIDNLHPTPPTQALTPAPAPAPAIDGVPSPQVSPLVTPSPPLSPLPDESHLRRSNKTNRGVLPLRLAKMLMAATEKTGTEDAKTDTQGMKQTSRGKPARRRSSHSSTTRSSQWSTGHSTSR